VSAPPIELRLAGRVGSFALDVAASAPGQGFTALFGHSGSGKTTVLRCVAGLRRLAGRVAIGGESWQDDTRGLFLAPHRRPIGYVFQEASLFAHLSVRANLRYGLRRARTDGGPAVAWDEAVDLLGLARLLDRDPATLSGGERQRVAIGRALLAQPRVLLMDEPLTGLDRPAREEILPFLEGLHRTLRIPVLYVSHDIGEVARLADSVIVLAEGRAIAQGPAAQVMERLDIGPATGRFEAGVLLLARIAGHDPVMRMTRLDLGGHPLSIPLAADLAVGSEVRLHIRARDVSLALCRPTGISIRNILEGTIAEIVEEPETAHVETLVDIGAGRLRARITREAMADLGLRPGMTVHALVKSIAFDNR